MLRYTKFRLFDAKFRLAVVSFLVMGLFLGVCLRLLWVQIVSGTELGKRAITQITDQVKKTAPRGKILDRNGEELLGAMQADLMPHVHAVRHLLPLLQDNVHARRYVMIGSPASAKPLAGYGETSITTAALRMYAQVVHQEAQALGVRAQMLEVCSPVCTPANAANACIEWPSSLLVGRRVVSLLDGCRDNRAIVRCDSSDAELPRGLLHLEVPPLWRDTAGIA